MPDNKLYFAIDFGSSKIKSILARKDDSGRIEVITINEVTSKGVSRGSIMNPTIAATQVSSLLKIVENNKAMTNKKINKVYSSFGGFSMTSSVLKEENLYDTKVTLSDEVIENMKQDVLANKLDTKYTSFKTIELEFDIDDLEISELKDCVGKKIVSRFLDIHGTQNLKEKLADTLPRVIENSDLLVTPIEIASAATTAKDREVGCAVVDFGHSTTSVIVYKENKIRHVGVVPFGSNSVTDDLKALNLTSSQADSIKQNYGAVHVDARSQMINLEVGGEPVQFDTYNLNKRVEARIDEIMDQVCAEIDKSGYYGKLSSGIIITGGGSKLKGLKDFVEFKSGMPARYANLKNILKENTPENFIKPEYAVLYGMILDATDDCTVVKEQIVIGTDTPKEPEPKQQPPKKKKHGLLGKATGKLTDMFFNDHEDGFSGNENKK